MKFAILILTIALMTWACTAPVGTSNAPTPKNWRVYLPSPSIDGMTTAAITGQASLTGPNPFAAQTPIVLIGTKPKLVIPAANTPYLMHGNTTAAGTFYLEDPIAWVSISNAVTGASDIQANYHLYKLDWTPISSISAIAHSGEVFTISTHGLQVGDTVYLAGYAANSKPSDAYLVVSVPSANSFTLSGTAPKDSDVFHYLAKVNDTPGHISF